MNKAYEVILDMYEYNEPIFTTDLQPVLNEQLDLKPSAFRQTIKRLADNGQLEKVQDGIYFIPNPNSILKTQMVSVEKIVVKKFIKKNDCDVFGYKSGVYFANLLGLTSQTASVPTIISNKSKSNKREVKYYNKSIILKKPKVTVNECNYKLLQVLDLFNEFERLSEEPISYASKKVKIYLSDVKIPEKEIKKAVEVYPDKVKNILYETGVFNELTHSR